MVFNSIDERKPLSDTNLSQQQIEAPRREKQKFKDNNNDISNENEMEETQELKSEQTFENQLFDDKVNSKDNTSVTRTSATELLTSINSTNTNGNMSPPLPPPSYPPPEMPYFENGSNLMSQQKTSSGLYNSSNFYTQNGQTSNYIDFVANGEILPKLPKRRGRKPTKNREKMIKRYFAIPTVDPLTGTVQNLSGILNNYIISGGSNVNSTHHNYYVKFKDVLKTQNDLLATQLDFQKKLKRAKREKEECIKEIEKNSNIAQLQNETDNDAMNRLSKNLFEAKSEVDKKQKMIKLLKLELKKLKEIWGLYSKDSNNNLSNDSTNLEKDEKCDEVFDFIKPLKIRGLLASHKDVSQQTEVDVSVWLTEFNWAAQYADRFVECAVDGPMLYELNDKLLQSELKIDNELHRIRLLNEIDRLKPKIENVSNKSNLIRENVQELPQLEKLPSVDVEDDVEVTEDVKDDEDDLIKPSEKETEVLTFPQNKEPIKIESEINACDSFGNQYPSIIKDIRPATREILVHFRGQSVKWDEQVSLDSNRFSELVQESRKRQLKTDNKHDDDNKNKIKKKPNKSAKKSEEKDKVVKDTLPKQTKKKKSFQKEDETDSNYGLWHSAYSASPFSRFPYRKTDIDLFDFMKMRIRARRHISPRVLFKQTSVGIQRARRCFADFKRRQVLALPLVPPKSIDELNTVIKMEEDHYLNASPYINNMEVNSPDSSYHETNSDLNTSRSDSGSNSESNNSVNNSSDNSIANGESLSVDSNEDSSVSYEEQRPPLMLPSPRKRQRKNVKDVEIEKNDSMNLSKKQVITSFSKTKNFKSKNESGRKSFKGNVEAVSEEETSSTQYEIDSVLDTKFEKDGTQYFLVKQKGFDHSENSWEPIHHFPEDSQVISKFLRRVKNG